MSSGLFKKFCLLQTICLQIIYMLYSSMYHVTSGIVEV